MNNKNNELKITILSMSLLTVMAGAAVSPALSNIKSNFSDVNINLIKMILTLPGLFIMLTNLIFPMIVKRLSIKRIAFVGLVLYTFGGAFGGLTNEIYLLLFSRVLLGIGVGFIMPLSTGLLVYYFDSNEQKKLMGYSVAMNNLGGIIAMSLSGYLSSIAWNYSFYVYLLGLIVITLVIVYLPNDRMEKTANRINIDLLKKEFIPLISVFLMMIAFYSYITNFSIQATKEGIVSSGSVGIIMSFQSIGALILAMLFSGITKKAGSFTKYIGLILFGTAFVVLLLSSYATTYMIALLLLGSGMGLVLPYLNTSAVNKVNKEMATSVMALMSVFMYSGQFLAPIISSGIMRSFNITNIRFPYIMAIISVVIIIFMMILDDKKVSE